MECACFNAGVDEYSEILSDTYPTANREYKCGECRRVIMPGEIYRLEKALFNRSADTVKTCIDCNSVREYLVCDFYWGEVWELVRESFRDYPDAIPWTKIGRLTPAARAMACEIIEDIWQADG